MEKKTKINDYTYHYQHGTKSWHYGETKLDLFFFFSFFFFFFFSFFFWGGGVSGTVGQIK